MLVMVFYWSHSNRCVVRFHCGLVCILLMPDEVEYWAFLCVCIFHLYLFSSGVSVQIFSHFLEKQVGRGKKNIWESPKFSPDPRGGKRELRDLLWSFLWLPNSQSGIESRDEAGLWVCVGKQGRRKERPQEYVICSAWPHTYSGKSSVTLTARKKCVFSWSLVSAVRLTCRTEGGAFIPGTHPLAVRYWQWSP